MLTNLVRDLDDHDLSILHTQNTQNGLVGVACVNPLKKCFRYLGTIFNVGFSKNQKQQISTHFHNIKFHSDIQKAYDKLNYIIYVNAIFSSKLFKFTHGTWRSRHFYGPRGIIRS